MFWHWVVYFVDFLTKEASEVHVFNEEPLHMLSARTHKAHREWYNIFRLNCALYLYIARFVIDGIVRAYNWYFCYCNKYTHCRLNYAILWSRPSKSFWKKWISIFRKVKLQLIVGVSSLFHYGFLTLQFVVWHAVGVHESRIRQVSLSQLLVAVLWMRI